MQGPSVQQLKEQEEQEEKKLAEEQQQVTPEPCICYPKPGWPCVCGCATIPADIVAAQIAMGPIPKPRPLPSPPPPPQSPPPRTPRPLPPLQRRTAEGCSPAPQVSLSRPLVHAANTRSRSPF